MKRLAPASRRRSARNPEFARGDGVRLVPLNASAAMNHSVTRVGWFIEPVPGGARVLLRFGAESHMPTTVDFANVRLDPESVGPTPESLGGAPLRWVIARGRTAWEKRYLRETGSRVRYSEYEWVRDPRDATHFPRLEGGAYVVSKALQVTGDSGHYTERYTVPDVDAEVRSLAEKYAATWAAMNAKPKPRPKKREQLAAEAKATFAKITDLVTRAEADALVRHAGAEPNGRRAGRVTRRRYARNSEGRSSFEPHAKGMLLGYKVMRYDPERGDVVSGANSSLRLPLRKGAVHAMPGHGIFLGSSARYVLTHYAVHDHNVLITYAFDPSTLTSGNLHDAEPEISVPRAKVVAFEFYDEDGDKTRRPRSAR